MKFTLSSGWDDQPKSWTDADGAGLEHHLRAIAIEVIVAGEAAYRRSVVRHRQWLIERKADAEKAETKRKIDAERKRRELEQMLQKQRIDHLLGQASAFHQATQIRAYVATVQASNHRVATPMTADELGEWSAWALLQADRIDPIISGQVRARPTEAAEPVEQ